MQRSKHDIKDRLTVIVTGPDKLFKFAWWATRIQLWRAKLHGVYVSPKHPEIPENLNGVVIGGGNDIDPKHYGLVGAAGANYDAARDQLELKVIHMAVDAQLPLLGICRGAQLINVANGGTLISDLRPLRKHTPNRNSMFAIKKATIKEDSQLAKILGELQPKVNSLHHQAVDQLGKDLIAVGHDDDGFIQAIEGTKPQFLVGVQWHPEYLLSKRTQQKLFKAFAAAAKQHHNSKVN